MRFAFLRRVARVGVALALGTVLAGPVRADEALRTELAAIARGIAEAVKGLGHDTVAVGEFTGPAQLATSSGPVITKTLAEELSKNGVAVKRVAAVGVKGEFEDVKDKQSGLLAARIKGTVTDRTGQVLFTFSRGVFGDNVLAALFGTTAKLPPDLSPAKRNAELEKSLDKPKVHVQGAQVSAAADSPYAVEILAAPQPGGRYASRPATIQDGLAFVPLRRGEVFGVKLINRSPHDAAVTLTIDGLNLYAFSDLKNPKTGGPDQAGIGSGVRGPRRQQRARDGGSGGVRVGQPAYRRRWTSGNHVERRHACLTGTGQRSAPQQLPLHAGRRPARSGPEFRSRHGGVRLGQDRQARA